MTEAQNKNLPLSQQRIDPDILQNGEQVVWSNTLPSHVIERWVKKVAEISGHPLDWAWLGGIASIMTTGNITEVIATMLTPELEDEYNNKYVLELKKLNLGDLESQNGSHLKDHIQKALSAEGDSLKYHYIMQDIERNKSTQ